MKKTISVFLLSMMCLTKIYAQNKPPQTGELVEFCHDQGCTTGEKEVFSTIDIKQYCSGTYPHTYCHSKNTLSKKLSSVIEIYIADNMKTGAMTREQKNKYFRSIQKKLEDISRNINDEKREFIFQYVSAIFDYHANQNIVFDSCGGPEKYESEYRREQMTKTDFYQIDNSQKKAVRLSKEKNTYGYIKQGCLAKDKSMFIIHGGGQGMICHGNIHRYNIKKQEGSTMAARCIDETHQRQGNEVFLTKNSHGHICKYPKYTYGYNFITNQTKIHKIEHIKEGGCYPEQANRLNKEEYEKKIQEEQSRETKITKDELIIKGYPNNKTNHIEDFTASTSETNTTKIRIQKGSNGCYKEFNEYLGQTEIRGCKLYTYSIFDTLTKKENIIGTNTKKMQHLGGNTILFDSQNNRLITRIGAIPIIPTLPIQTAGYEQAINNNRTQKVTTTMLQVKEDSTIDVRDKGQDRKIGGANVYYSNKTNIISIIPKDSIKKHYREIDITKKDLTPVLIKP